MVLDTQIPMAVRYLTCPGLKGTAEMLYVMVSIIPQSTSEFI